MASHLLIRLFDARMADVRSINISRQKFLNISLLVYFIRYKRAEQNRVLLYRYHFGRIVIMRSHESNTSFQSII